VSTFERSSGWCAIVVGAAGFLYSVSFVATLRGVASLGTWAAIFLLIGAINTVQVVSALYRRTRDVDAGFALTAVLFGLVGALAAALHGGYDLANAVHPPSAAATDFPSPMDPRGLGTFGFAGLALLVFSRLIQRGAIARDAVDLAARTRLPHGLAMLGYISGILLVLTYLGRLIVLDPNSLLILVPAGVEGFVVNPIWYVWLGVALLRGPRS
jgi:hypothetical protein